MHHTEYLNDLIRNKLITPHQSELKTVFHNPCELGRGCDVYAAPDQSTANRESMNLATVYDGSNSLCCGGSLANIHIESRTTYPNQ